MASACPGLVFGELWGHLPPSFQLDRGRHASAVAVAVAVAIAVCLFTYVYSFHNISETSERVLGQ